MSNTIYGDIQMTENILKTFQDRLPSHLFATDDFMYGLRFHAKAQALEKAIIQANAKHSITWLVFDVDSETAATDWLEKDVPAPNILCINPANGHGHYFYGLSIPVHNYSHASDKAKRYLAYVDNGLTHKLGADLGYAKLMAKNPLNSKWITEILTTELYELAKLEQGFNVKIDYRRKPEAIGYGRNCILFDSVRKWAYKERRSYNTYFNYDFFLHAVLSRALQVNTEFNPPLPHSEVRATAKSIAKWTWANMSQEGFKQWQSRQGKKSGVARKAKSQERLKQILETKEQCPNLSQSDIASMLGLTRQTVNNLLRARELKE